MTYLNLCQSTYKAQHTLHQIMKVSAVSIWQQVFVDFRSVVIFWAFLNLTPLHTLFFFTIFFKAQAGLYATGHFDGVSPNPWACRGSSSRE